MRYVLNWLLNVALKLLRARRQPELPSAFAKACHDMQVQYGEREEGDYTGLSNTPPRSMKHGW